MKVLYRFELMNQIMRNLVASDSAGRECALDIVYHWFKEQTEYTQNEHGKLIFIGNGGSASICSHMAIDYSKNGKIPAICFSDGALLTCLSNDLGFEEVFVNALKMYSHSNDMLIAISSSGKSPNIINAVKYAKSRGIPVLTLSGFETHNPLRFLGDYNIYTPSLEYGQVEVSHLHFCHAILDLIMEETADNLYPRQSYLFSQDKGIHL